ncbi:hypothetical protein Poly24_33660 [Rosistilla carotiformis]|uniref:Uncharacterized protein n=1 Tax=Rosistilla carotiformis TaxID=2528017 RepID=A0A518JVT5_9BACT|nr:hypothetical protein [Rosistilla carotiformis]QDV69649.1 hypothetical protein Poly24_33660 [Rosistilla carotiformis]
MSTEMKPREILVQTNHGLIFTVVVPQDNEAAQPHGSLTAGPFGTGTGVSRGDQPRSSLVRSAS